LQSDRHKKSPPKRAKMVEVAGVEIA